MMKLLHDEHPDNWWDMKHRGENPLALVPDEQLQAELDRRQLERRKIELMKIANGREAFAYFTLSGGDERYADWKLHIVFTDGSNHCFTFSSRVGHTDETMREFRELYYPNLLCYHYDDYVRFEKSKRKGKNCRGKNGNCVSAKG
jgi:hypothetical protein